MAVQGLKVLPCPCCGGTAKVECLFDRFLVKCLERACALRQGHSYETEEAAVRAWNNRAS